MSPTIVISGVDTLIGQQITQELQRNHQTHVGQEIRALYNRNNSDMRPVVEYLQTQGCDLQAVEYHEVSSIEQQLRNRDYMILVPPMQAGQQPMAWQQESERIIQAAKNAQVKNLILISYVGCDQRPEKKHLNGFEKLEKKAREQFGTQFTILRINFGQQHFRLWVKDIQDGELRVPFSQSSTFAPVDLNDVARVIAKIIKGEKELPKEHRGQTYQLTGPLPITGKKLTEYLGEAAGRGASHVQIRETDRDEVQTRLLREWRQMLQQRNFDPQTGPYTINEPYVELLMDICELVREGKLQTATQDVKRILNQDPMPMDKVLKHHQEEFRSHGRN